MHNEVRRRLFESLFEVDATLNESDFTGSNLNENCPKLARMKNIPKDVFQKKSQQLLENYDASFGNSLTDNATNYILPGAM